MTEYTKEPWRVDGSVMAWADAVSEYVAFTTDDDHLLPHSTCAANARRIVACVNACAGVATTDLEEVGGNFGAVYADAKKRISELEQQRDQLREALKFYANPEVYKPDSVGRTPDITHVARAALAAAGGE